MTTEGRLDRELHDILGDLARGPYPDYIDDVLVTTGHARQRADWTFLERWLPMTETVRGLVLTPRFPWRSIAMGVILIALLVAALGAALVGGAPHLPAPYGLARTGLVAYAAGGDIYVADALTGRATAVVSGPATDLAPRFSPDGTHVVFLRRAGGLSQLYVARSDGRDLTLVTPGGVLMTTEDTGRNYEFAPDGRSVLYTSMVDGRSTLSIAQADGSGVRPVDVGMPALDGTFRPPDGSEVLFAGVGSDGNHGLFAVHLATGVVREIVAHSPGRDLTGGAWSPDGQRILYWTWSTLADGATAATHVIGADGRDIALPVPEGAVWNAVAAWSNDGTRIFLVRGYTGGSDDVRPAVLPADGSSVGIEIPFQGSAEPECCSAWLWSPDDALVLGRPGGPSVAPAPVIIDVAASRAAPAPWTSVSDPTWQRLAP